MIRVDVYLEDPAAILGSSAFDAGALIRIERAAASDGAYAEVGTVAVDTATFQPFTYYDADGDAGSWYRWRISDSGDMVHSPYSGVFQGSSPTEVVAADAYASLGDVLALFDTPVSAKRYPRWASLLRTATAELIGLMGNRDFFRHPASGSATFYLDSDSRRWDLVHAHDGIVSIDTIELSDDGGSTFSAITAGDYFLRGSDPDSDRPIPDGEPAFHIVFSGLGARTTFSRGKRVIRLTGVRGWPAIPRRAVEGVAERARGLAFADPSYEGFVPSPPDMGQPGVDVGRLPDVLYRLVENERHRFWCYV